MEIDNTKPGYKIDKPIQIKEVASISNVSGYGTLWFDSATKEFKATLSDGTILSLFPRYGGMAVTAGSGSLVGASSSWHGYKGFSEGIAAGLEFIAGIYKNDISGFATWDSGNKTKVTTTGAHGLSEGDIISLTSTTNYNGVHIISEVGTNDFVIDIAFVSDDGSGILCRPDVLKVDDAGAGNYEILWTAGVSVETDADLCKFGIFINDAPANITPHQFASIDDANSLSGCALVELEAGDVVWFGYENMDHANDITMGEMSFIAKRL